MPRECAGIARDASDVEDRVQFLGGVLKVLFSVNSVVRVPFLQSGSREFDPHTENWAVKIALWRNWLYATYSDYVIAVGSNPTEATAQSNL